LSHEIAFNTHTQQHITQEDPCWSIRTSLASDEFPMNSNCSYVSMSKNVLYKTLLENKSSKFQLYVNLEGLKWNCGLKQQQFSPHSLLFKTHISKRSSPGLSPHNQRIGILYFSHERSAQSRHAHIMLSRKTMLARHALKGGDARTTLKNWSQN
jgi:hypothetical protein